MYNLCDINDIKKIAKKYRFHFSKGLGQNFLTNPEICPKISSLGVDAPSNGVIEIGTGFGVLTKELAKNSKKVVAIEIDKSLIPILKDTLSDYDNVKIINADVLKVDLKKVIEEEFLDTPVHICANLPYYITSPILMYILEENLPIKSVTVMVQKETAIRLCADLGTRECSAITFAVRYYATPKILFYVDRDSFIPSPNVDSAVIRLDINDNKPEGVQDPEYLFAVVKAAFSQRRKTIANPISHTLKIAKDTVLSALDTLNLSRQSRAEELSQQNFIDLANLLLELSKGDN